MDNTRQKDFNDAEFLAKKSWLAYVFPVAIWGGFSLAIISANIEFIVFSIIALGVMIYKVLMLRSVSLFLDDDGIWVSSGIFPWNTGTHGVKWENFDEAVFYPGFISWLFKSYLINVTNKFTNASELILAHMDKGEASVERINQYKANHSE